MANASEDQIQKEVQASLSKQMDALIKEMGAAGMHVISGWRVSSDPGCHLAVGGVTINLLEIVTQLACVVIQGYKRAAESDEEVSASQAIIDVARSYPNINWIQLLEEYEKLEIREPEAANG